MESKIWTKDEIKELLEKRDDAVIRGLLAIWNKQTEAEREYGETAEHNNVGFNAIDAKICSSFVRFYNDAGFLTPKQMVIARKKVMKYAGQLKKIANREYETDDFINQL
jgi:hypothetical protein